MRLATAKEMKNKSELFKVIGYDSLNVPVIKMFVFGKDANNQNPKVAVWNSNGFIQIANPSNTIDWREWTQFVEKNFEVLMVELSELLDVSSPEGMILRINYKVLRVLKDDFHNLWERYKRTSWI